MTSPSPGVAPPLPLPPLTFSVPEPPVGPAPAALALEAASYMAWASLWEAVVSSSMAFFSSLMLSLSLRDLSLSTALMTASLSDWLILSPYSLRVFSVVYTSWSAWFLVSASSFVLLSSSPNLSASLLIFSTSSFDRPEEEVMVIFCSLPVPRSLALAFRMPLASMSKETSIWGMPLGAEGMPISWKRPRVRLSLAMGLSPWMTWMSTAVWLSAAVENTSFLPVGMVVFLGISTVITPPRVSTPRESGVTSSRRMSLISPLNTAAWMAAPTATTSSGLTPLQGYLLKRSFTSCCTLGIRIIPQTSTTSSILSGGSFASDRAVSQGLTHLCTRCSTSCSSLALVMVIVRCLCPAWSAVMKGRFTSVLMVLESSHLAFSAASSSLWWATASFLRSMPVSFLNSSAI